MYIGNLGIIQAGRKPASICVVNVGLIDVHENDFDIADIIIGMDIICMGRLIIDGKSKSFSFEI